jgi:hypothetical protein
MLDVFPQGVRINDNIVEVDVHPTADILAEEIVHQRLIGCRCVTVSLL